MNQEKICGTCKWHSYDDEWVCTNSDSDFYTDETPYDHTCEEWEGWL